MCNSEEISKEFKLIDRYWKASNYLADVLDLIYVFVGQVNSPYFSHWQLAPSLPKLRDLPTR
jgi:hypothetical protein